MSMRPPRSAARRAVLLAALALASCTETVSVEPPPDYTLERATQPDVGTWAVFTNLAAPPSVRVVDAAGQPVPGVRVVFHPTEGRGMVTGSAVLTNADGIATVGSWRFGERPGPQELSAAIVSATLDARVTFTGTAVAGPVATLSVRPTLFSLQVNGTRQLRVDAEDAFGNLVGTDVPATFSSSDTTVATVSATGLVTARAFGTARITVVYQGVVVQVVVGVGSRPIGVDVSNVLLAGRPYGGVITSQGFAYVGRVETPDVARYNITDPGAVLAPLTLSGASYDLDFLPDGSRGYGVVASQQLVSVVDRATNAQLRTIPLGHEPFRVKVHPDGSKVYVTTSDGQVFEIDVASEALRSVGVGGVLNGLAVNPARGVLYATGTDGVLHEVRLSDLALLRTVTLGGTPQGVTVSLDGQRLFLADESQGLRVLDAASLNVTATLPQYANAFDVLLTRDGIELYVSRALSGTVHVLDARDLSLLRSIAGGAPRRMAISPDGSTVVIANEAGYVTFVR